MPSLNTSLPEPAKNQPLFSNNLTARTVDEVERLIAAHDKGVLYFTAKDQPTFADRALRLFSSVLVSPGEGWGMMGIQQVDTDKICRIDVEFSEETAEVFRHYGVEVVPSLFSFTEGKLRLIHKASENMNTLRIGVN